jgi:hypothetical protein
VHWKLFGLQNLEQPRACASADFSDNRKNIMKLTIYDIIEKVIAAWRFLV